MRGGDPAAAAPGARVDSGISVVTNQYDAEYGRGSGGIVNAITKQGTNALRGSAFGFFTGSRVTAPDFFTKQQGLPGPTRRSSNGEARSAARSSATRSISSSAFENVNQNQGLSRVPSRSDLTFSDVVYSDFWNTVVRADYQASAQNSFTFRWLSDYQPIRQRSGSHINPGAGNDPPANALGPARREGLGPDRHVDLQPRAWEHETEHPAAA